MTEHDVRSRVTELARSARQRRRGDGWTGLVLGAALVAMALVAGLIYTFSVAVMPNLAGADDRTFVVTMQRFNENPAAAPCSCTVGPRPSMIADRRLPGRLTSTSRPVPRPRSIR
jgi:hypothetical protein